MIIAVLAVSLTLILGTVCSVFAQSDDIGSVLNKAQKSLSQNTEDNIKPTLSKGSYKTYENLHYNVKMQYPKDWDFNETGYDEIFPDRVFNVRFNSPVTSDIVLFSISIENLDPTTTTLNQYKDRITNNVKTNPDAKDISISDTNLDGKPAYRIEYLSSIVGSESKSIYTTSVNNGRLQEVSVFGDQPAIDKYSEEIANMIKSVKFGKPASTEVSASDDKVSDKTIVKKTTHNNVVKKPTTQRNCDASYPDFCIPSPPPNLNCPDIPQKRFTVSGSDPQGFDRDNDGIGCES
jgi:hypothetical protein